MWGCHIKSGHRRELASILIWRQNERLKHCSNQRKVLFLFLQWHLLFIMCSEVKVWRRPSSPAQWLHEEAKKKEWKRAPYRNSCHWLAAWCVVCCWVWAIITYAEHSLSLVGRGFFSFVSVFFSFVLSKREISVMSGLSAILPVADENLGKRHLSSGAHRPEMMEV